MTTTRALLLLSAFVACASARSDGAAPAPADAPARAHDAEPASDAGRTSPALAPAASVTPTRTIDDDGRSLFAAEGLRGGFIVVDGARGDRVEVGPDELGVRHLPASTFKIPNTVIGLETGVIADEHLRLRWDRSKQRVKAWEQDHDLASAMKHSVVWYYQEIARRIGAARMQEWLLRLDYGNHDQGGGIDRFWLDGALRISAREQVRFLRRLDAGELGVSARTRAIVDRITILEEGPGYVWRGKTGLTEEDGRTIGWLIGSVERGGQRWYYATIIAHESADYEYVAPRRRTITRALLVRRGLLPASAPG